MIRKTLTALTLALALTPLAHALGGYNTLTGDDKKVTDVVKEQLNISADDAYALFDGYLKGYLDTKDWHYNYYNNTSIDSSKLGKSSTRTLYMNFVTDNRFINVTLVRFGAEGQVMVQAVETLPRTTQVVIDKYNNVKADAEFSAEVDKEAFSSFRKKGYSNRVKALVNGSSAAIQYVDMYVHTLKGKN